MKVQFDGNWREEMMFSARTLTAAAALATTIAMGVLPVPVAAQPGNNQRGLVNVAVFRVIDDVTVKVQDVNVGVGVAANIAANVCNVAVPVAVLAQQVVVAGGEFTCSNDVDDSSVIIGQG